MKLHIPGFFGDYRFRLVISGVLLFALFSPVGVRGRMRRFEREVYDLRRENARLRDMVQQRFDDLSRSLVALRSLAEFKPAVAAASADDSRGGRSFDPPVVPGNFCAASGRSGVSSLGSTWWIGDFTPYGDLRSCGIGWADFGGTIYRLERREL